MKKVLAIILSAIMALSVSMGAVSAFAATVGSQETTVKQATITVRVNGQTSSDVTYERDPDDSNKITFTYNGEGSLSSWEFSGATEGVDYEILSEDGDSITIELINGFDGEISVNAIVDEDEDSDEDAEDEEDEDTDTSSNTSTTSPDTGVLGASGLAVAAAGVAVLKAIKKRDAE